MNRRQRHSRLSPLSGSAERDMEALQTDVMRFMSIISLCLMAVFALVQSIPAPEGGKASGLSPISSVHETTDTWKKQATDSQVIPRARQKKDDRLQKVSTFIQQPPETESAAKPETTKRRRPAPAAKSASSGLGLSLRFESVAVLDQLVRSGSVTLYGLLDRQAWRLSVVADRSVAVPSLFPVWFHEMSLSTVPEHYIHGLGKVTGGPESRAAVWGVQLPEATRTAIAALTRSQQGGVLVIRSDGQVVREE